MEWCEEKYSVRFDTKDRRDFPLEDPLYNASQLVTGWLDPDAFVEMGGAPLGTVMDMLGYKGDRSGLLESSKVTDSIVSGDELRFTVVDNFSDFNICRALAERLGVDFGVDVKYRFSEGENMEHESDWQHHDVRCRSSIVKELKDVIGMTLSEFGLDEGLETVPVVSSFPAADWRIESFGPASDSINLVSDWSTEESQARVSLHLSDVSDVRSLEVLLRLAKDNYERLSESSMRASLMVDVGSGEELTGTRAYVSEMLQRLDAYVDSLTDGEGWNEETSGLTRRVWNYLAGDGVPEMSVSDCLDGIRSICGDNPWMNGFVSEAEALAVGYGEGEETVGLHDEVDRGYVLTQEDAVEIARHAALADGGETDLSGEVAAELEHGASPAEALREWDVEVPEDYQERKDRKYVAGERAAMLGELYGSSGAYQNVSEYMLGFDLDYHYPARLPLEWEDVERIVRSHSPSVPEALVENAAEMYRSGAWSAEKAVESFAIAVTEDMYRHEPDRLDFRYDGDVMVSFTKAPEYGPDRWVVSGQDDALLALFKERTGNGLRERMELDVPAEVKGAYTSRTLMEEARRALLTPANREAAREAETRCIRKMRQRDMMERFNQPLRPRGNGKGVK